MKFLLLISKSWVLTLNFFLLIIVNESLMSYAHNIDELCTLCLKSFEVKILKIEITRSNIKLCSLMIAIG
jgi:hypothetical protein